MYIRGLPPSSYAMFPLIHVATDRWSMHQNVRLTLPSLTYVAPSFLSGPTHVSTYIHTSLTREHVPTYMYVALTTEYCMYVCMYVSMLVMYVRCWYILPCVKITRLGIRTRQPSNRILRLRLSPVFAPRTYSQYNADHSLLLMYYLPLYVSADRQLRFVSGAGQLQFCFYSVCTIFVQYDVCSEYKIHVPNDVVRRA